MSSKCALEIKNLSFTYGSTPILNQINLKVLEGESLAIVGPSGYGKTTLLQLIAGDLLPTSGSLVKMGLWRRVFQKSTLLPWLTVEENIKIGLRNVGQRDVLDFKKLVDLLDLAHVLDFYPRQLSGGMGQRTEIARALIGKPDGLLLDEPFSSLDYLIRHETRNYLVGLLQEFPISLILVTHDLPEAVSFTQKTYVINGRPATIIKEYENKGTQQDIVESIWKDLKK